MCDREGCVVASLVDEGHPLIWPVVVDAPMASGRQTSWLIESAVDETDCACCAKIRYTCCTKAGCACLARAGCSYWSRANCLWLIAPAVLKADCSCCEG